jgi:FtsH-binding integral membrane protein
MLFVGEKILLALWVGGMWTVGYVVAPTLFAMLEKSVAGNVAGQLFTTMSYIGLVCGSLLLIGKISRLGSSAMQNWVVWALVVMLVLVVISQFVLQPMMAELKASGITDLNRSEFGKLHGVASVLFLINSLLGLPLVVTQK